MGGLNYSDDTIGQTAIVPSWAETAALYFDSLMFSTDSSITGYDRLAVGVVDVSSTTVLAVGSIWNNGMRSSWIHWRLPVNNISQWRGRQVAVILFVANDGYYPSWWYVDGVELYFACGSYPASTDEELVIDTTENDLEYVVQRLGLLKLSPKESNYAPPQRP